MNKPYRYEQPEMVHQMLKSYAPIQLVDVRSHGEFADGHAKGAKLIPLAELSREQLVDRLGPDVVDNQTLYFICEAGDRARQAVHNLQQQSLDNLVIVGGGTSAWRNQGLPMKRTSRLPSLERQTQIAIGGLLLLVLAKGLLIHPLFYALIAFMGIGLITAGVTAKCTLSALLAKMPWNQLRPNNPA